MLKKTIISSFSLMILMLSSNEALFAQNCASTQYMPQYQATFTVPLGTENSDKATTMLDDSFLILRFYQAWGDGESTGWQTPLRAPKVTLDGEQLYTGLYFSYDTAFYKYGSFYFGFDQYAQYYLTEIPNRRNPGQLVVTGTFEQVAYLSAVVYSASDVGPNQQEQVLDKEMSTLNNACHPYIEDNPSVFAYPAKSNQAFTQDVSVPVNDRFRQQNALDSFPKNNDKDTGQIAIYRLNAESSLEVMADDIAPDGCSRAYLFGFMDAEDDIAILRMKVPTTFLDGNEPDKIFGDYQTRYFSASSHRKFPTREDPTILNYWGVNAAMLKDYQDDDGYAYVFFAPNKYVKEMADEQNTAETEPPVMKWGRYTGYLVGYPDFSIILRYRDPSLSWDGSPENAVCYPTARQQRTVEPDELGEYFPEIFADTLDNFSDGNIGDVSNRQPWPN
jgi:hypothetical protein